MASGSNNNKLNSNKKLTFTFRGKDDIKDGNRTFTLTFGDQAENHYGMQKIGTFADIGFTYDDLLKGKLFFDKAGHRCELVNLNQALPNEYKSSAESAYILVVPNGVEYFINSTNTRDDFFREMAGLEMDKKAKMRGRVVNKHARHNLCFGPQQQEPDYENGKGRIISYGQVPILNKVRTNLNTVLGSKAEDLVVELNDYYDIGKCGIGFHGDSERRRVVGVRLGATTPLHYQWFYQRKPIGGRVVVTLNHGDMYMMSEKAVGTDWKRYTQITLRHAAGCPKYTTIKQK